MLRIDNSVQQQCFLNHYTIGNLITSDSREAIYHSYIIKQEQCKYIRVDTWNWGPITNELGNEIHFKFYWKIPCFQKSRFFVTKRVLSIRVWWGVLIILCRLVGCKLWLPPDHGCIIIGHVLVQLNTCKPTYDYKNKSLEHLQTHIKQSNFPVLNYFTKLQTTFNYMCDRLSNRKISDQGLWFTTIPALYPIQSFQASWRLLHKSKAEVPRGAWRHSRGLQLPVRLFHAAAPRRVTSRRYVTSLLTVVLYYCVIHQEMLRIAFCV